MQSKTQKHFKKRATMDLNTLKCAPKTVHRGKIATEIAEYYCLSILAAYKLTRKMKNYDGTDDSSKKPFETAG